MANQVHELNVEQLSVTLSTAIRFGQAGYRCHEYITNFSRLQSTDLQQFALNNEGHYVFWAGLNETNKVCIATQDRNSNLQT